MQTNLHGLVKLTQIVGGRMIERGKGRQGHQYRESADAAGIPLHVGLFDYEGGDRTADESPGRRMGGVQHPGQLHRTGLHPDRSQSRHVEDGEMRNWMKGSQANSRFGTPEDVAALAVFLASPGSDYITGQVISVDGGHSTTSRWPFQPPQS